MRLHHGLAFEAVSKLFADSGECLGSPYQDGGSPGRCAQEQYQGRQERPFYEGKTSKEF